MKDKTAEYQNKRMQYLAGILSEQDWKEYCMQILCQKMEENKEIFIRLKDR